MARSGALPVDNGVTSRGGWRMMYPVSTHLGTTETPPATRAVAPGWRDPRLWLGLGLVALSVLVGARVFAAADDTVPVWAAATDLAAGQPLDPDDLRVVEVRFADGAEPDRYLPASAEPPVEATLVRSVASGELLPAQAVGRAGEPLVEVPLATAALPAGLRPGAAVDVWVTPAAGGEAVTAERVLHDVVVVSTSRAEAAFGPGGEQQVLLGVPEDGAEAVGRVLAAAADGRVALTRRR